jgi:hypothetical protein
MEVLDSCGTTRDDAPESHAGWEVDARADARQYEIGRNLQRNVTRKKNRDACIKLLANKSQISLDVLEAGVGQSVTVEITVVRVLG